MRRVVTVLGRLRRRVNWIRLMIRLRYLAIKAGAKLDLDIHPDIEVRKRVQFEIAPGTVNSIKIGRHCRLMGDLMIRFMNGHMDFGEQVEIRRGTMLNLTGGRLRCEGGNKIGYFNLVHCSAGITLEQYAGSSEYCSLIDVTHDHDGSDTPFFESEISKPIYIGFNTWLTSKCTVLQGVTIGRNCVVAAHAVVNKDVNDGEVVGGIPAKVISTRPVAARSSN